MKRILKFIGCLALGCVGLTTLADTIQVSDQTAFNNAVAAAKAGDVIEITAAGTYTMPNVPQNITIQSKDGVDVTFNCAGSGSICSIPNGAKFVNVAFSMGGNKYHGWQHPGALEFEGCKFEGMFFSYGKMTFTGCTFNQTTEEYHMWDYGGELTFMDCVFNGKGKFLNVYNEGNDDGSPWILTMTRCKFCSDTKNKAALNVKSTSTTADGVVTALKYTVDIEGCSFEGEFPSASTSDSLIVFNELVQLDDIKPAYPNTITITQDGRVIYKNNAPIPEPITVSVEKNEEKGITQDVVTEITVNKEVGKLEETGLKEALPAEELAKGEPVIKVQLQEVAANTLKFDVSPYVGEKKVDSEKLNGKPVAVRLPLVAAKFDGEYAKIIHGSDPVQFVLVKTGTTGAYVDLTLTHFSEVDLLLANAEEIVKAVDPSAVEIQSGLWGANGKTTIADAEIVYIVGATGLKAFRDWVNAGNSGEGKTFQLVADVDLGSEDWIGIAKEEANPFKGTFDGKGHEIINFYGHGSDYGLFCYTSDGAYIKNFAVRGTVFAADDNNAVAGTVIGIMNGGTLDSVTNYATVSAKQTYGRIGGLVGNTKSDNGLNIIKNCVNFGSLVFNEGESSTKSGKMGGIIGQVTSSKTQVFNCTNYGTLTDKLPGLYIGGIIGYIQWKNDFETGVFKVENCTNYGKIETSGGSDASGIIGYVEFGVRGATEVPRKEDLFLTVGNCANYGKIDSTAVNVNEFFIGTWQNQSKFLIDGLITVRTDNATTESVMGQVNKAGSKELVATCPGTAKDINGNDINVDTYYLSIAGAIAAAKAGDTVTLVANTTESVVLPADVSFDCSAVTAYDTTKISAAAGCRVKDLGNRLFKSVRLQAKIGTTEYETVAEAVVAAREIAERPVTITILPGTHTVNETIMFEQSDLAIVGEEGAALVAPDKVDMFTFCSRGTCKNITFRNLTLKASNAAAIQFKALQSETEPWDMISNLRVENCVLENVGGVDTKGDCAALKILARCENLVFVNNTVKGFYDALQFSWHQEWWKFRSGCTGYNVIANNVFDGNTHNELILASTIYKKTDGTVVEAEGPQRKFIVANNVMKNSTNRAIKFYQDENAEIILQGNELTNAYDEDKEFFQVTNDGNIPPFHNIKLTVWSGNTCDGKAFVDAADAAEGTVLLDGDADSKIAGKLGEKAVIPVTFKPIIAKKRVAEAANAGEFYAGYATLAEAAADAYAGDTIQQLADAENQDVVLVGDNVTYKPGTYAHGKVSTTAAYLLIVEDDPAIDGAKIYRTEALPDLVKGEDRKYHIASSQNLYSFRKMVNGGTTFGGETVVLDNDITFAGEWNSGIGILISAEVTSSTSFKGVFDGCGYKIVGLKITNTTAEGVGLFNCLVEANVEQYDTVVKNVTLENAAINGKKYVGSICGYSFRAVIENCKVVGSSIVGGTQVGGILGRSQALGRVSGCEISASTVTATTDRAGGIVGVMQGGNIVGNSVIGTEESKLVISAAAVNAGCGAGAIVSQIYNNDGGDNTITDNNVIYVETKTAETVDFVPVGNLASGWYQSDYNHIVLRNHWEPKTEPDYYDMQDFAHLGTYTRVNNFHAVAQIEGKGLAARYESLQAACLAANDYDEPTTICLLVDTDVGDLVLTRRTYYTEPLNNNITIDLDSHTMKANSCDTNMGDNELKVLFKNGMIDIRGATGHAMDYEHTAVFYPMRKGTLEFDNVNIVGWGTLNCWTFATFSSATSKLRFVNGCVVELGNCLKAFEPQRGPIEFVDSSLVIDGNTGDASFHDENAAAAQISFLRSNVEIRNSRRAFADLGLVSIDASRVVCSNLTKEAFLGVKSVDLKNGAKLLVDKTTGISAGNLLVGQDCEVVAVTEADAFKLTAAGSVFANGSKVEAKSIALSGAGTLTVENGADVTVAGNVGTTGGLVSIAAGKYNTLTGADEMFDLTGGIYTASPKPEYVNPAYQVVDNKEESTMATHPYRVEAKPLIVNYEDAEGETKGTYSLEKAVELVKVGGTITLLAPNAENFTTTRTEPFTLVTSEGKAFSGKITMPNGYALKDNGNGTYSYYKMPIATITREGVTTAYDSLPAACAAAQNGDTIVLSPMIIDATDTYVIKDLTFKKVTLKGAGRDKTVLDWGNGYKLGTDGAGTDSNNHLSADLTFENLALTITHADGMPYDEWMKHPNSVTFRNATINGQYVAIDPTLFDNCNFTGPVNGYDEYLIWVYGSETVVSNCTFEKSGSHACIKLYNDSGYMCSAKVLGTTSFAKIGDEGGVITVSHSLITAADSDFAYDLQIDTDAVTIPDGAKFVGHDPGEWGAQGITVVNGTMKNDKYVSGAVFSDRGTDKQICDIAAKVIGPDSACLAYVGPATVLGNFRWYIGDKQLTPKTDNVQVEGVPPDAPLAVKDKVVADTNNVIQTLSSDDITKFADTDVAGSSFNEDGTPKEEVKQALIDAANEQAVKDAIAAQLGESNSNERVEIKLDKFNFTVQDQSATLSVVEYDVKPWIKVTTVVGDVETVTEAVIPNSALAGHPLTFRLAVNSNFGQYAKVIHKDGDTVLETYLTEVFTGKDGGKYVQLKSDHFSNFFVSADVTEPKCKVGDQFYDSVQEAIEENADVPDAVFTLTAPCGETGLPLKWGQEIDVNGQPFTGSIIPAAEPESGYEADLYEQVQTPAGRVFSAPKQVSVVTAGGTIKVRMLGKTAEELAEVQPSGRPLWQDRALGSIEKLIPQVLRSAIGVKTITIRSNLDDAALAAAAKVRDGVRVKYQLMKKVGGTGTFAQFGEALDVPDFTVEADELEVQTFWKILTIFDEEY